MANLDNILKSRDIALLTEVHLVKGVVIPVVIPVSCMDVGVGPQSALSTEELMLFNCGVGEDS